ncbi:MAG: M28 family peptidase [Elusimicrobiota bacterium]|nr:M28 family peptidase [Elusimicrobiota bacterium]
MISKKRLLYLLVFTAAAYAVLKLTTIGWNIWAPAYPGGTTRTEPEKLKATVTALAVGIGPRDLYNNNRARLRKAEDYLTARLKAAGCRVEYQEYSAGGVKVKNIICVKAGLTAPGEIIVIGAHYDTFNNPGADDNASGMAGVLELAEYAAAKKYGRTIKFIAFANEEPPFFRSDGMGSAVYAKAAAGRKEDIKAALVLEMIGYFSEERLSQRYPPLIGAFLPNRGNFIAQVSNLASRKLAGRIDKVFAGATKMPLRTVSLPSFVPGVDYSDHRSFWNAGYPAVMFTDTSFYRTPNYHQFSDLPDTLNYRYMAAFLDGMKAVLDDLAGKK